MKKEISGFDVKIGRHVDFSKHLGGVAVSGVAGGGGCVIFCPIRQQLNPKKWPKMAIFDYIFTM